MKNSPALEQLIDSLRCLPGVGPKSAQRMAYYLLQHDRKGANGLAIALDNALQVVDHCKLCNTFSEQPICQLCAEDSRDKSLLCVVEMPTDLLMLENTRAYTGEGDATAHYISELLRTRGIKTSRIARGMPMGGEIEYVDSGTLAQAMMERRSIT